MIYYHVDKTTQSIISGPHEVQSTYIRKLTNCGNPGMLNLREYDLREPIFAMISDGQKYGEPFVAGGEVLVPAISKTQEEFAAELAQKIDSMHRAASEWYDTMGALGGRKTHPAITALVIDKATKGKPKSGAVKIWGLQVWGLYYQRVAALEAGGIWSDDLLDFSVVGPCPYSVKDVLTE